MHRTYTFCNKQLFNYYRLYTTLIVSVGVKYELQNWRFFNTCNSLILAIFYHHLGIKYTNILILQHTSYYFPCFIFHIKGCYYIPDIPDGEWFCRPCSEGVQPKCILCNQYKGAMAITRYIKNKMCVSNLLVKKTIYRKHGSIKQIERKHI